MFIAFGLAFEVPIAVVVLARMGVVSVEKLKNFRGYFIVIAFVIAAIVTPPDVVSQLALAIPMCMLYESGYLGRADFHQAHQGTRGHGRSRFVVLTADHRRCFLAAGLHKHLVGNRSPF
jgi:Sec-independent protein secretion pathway component TatC